MSDEHNTTGVGEPAPLMVNISGSPIPSTPASNDALQNSLDLWQPPVSDPYMPLGSLQRPYPRQIFPIPVFPKNFLNFPQPTFQTSLPLEAEVTSNEPNLPWKQAHHYAGKPDPLVGSSATIRIPPQTRTGSDSDGDGDFDFAKCTITNLDESLPPIPSSNQNRSRLSYPSNPFSKKPKPPMPPPVPPKKPLAESNSIHRNRNQPLSPPEFQSQPQIPSLPRPPPRIHCPKRSIRYGPTATIRYPNARAPSSSATITPPSSLSQNPSAPKLSTLPSSNPPSSPSPSPSSTPQNTTKTPPPHTSPIPLLSPIPNLVSPPSSLNPYTDWPLCSLCADRPATLEVATIRFCERCWKEVEKEEEGGSGELKGSGLRGG